MVRTWHFDRRSLGSVPGLGTEIPPQAAAYHGLKDKHKETVFVSLPAGNAAVGWTRWHVNVSGRQGRGPHSWGQHSSSATRSRPQDTPTPCPSPTLLTLDVSAENCFLRETSRNCLPGSGLPDAASTASPESLPSPCSFEWPLSEAILPDGSQTPGWGGGNHSCHASVTQDELLAGAAGPAW